MAFGVDVVSHPSPVTGVQSITGSHTCGAGATKLVILPGNGLSSVPATERDVTGCTYNGVACSFVAREDNSTNWAHAEIWQLNSPATGAAHDWVVTYGNSAIQSQIAASAISFNDAAAASGTPNTAEGSGANANVTVVDSASGDIVVSNTFSDVGPISATTEAGTLIAEDEDISSDSDYNAQRQVASGASTVCSWTHSAELWAACGVAIRTAGGGFFRPPKSRPFAFKPGSLRPR
jgi:hypothetical protein